jgi:Protein of unknown function (DUF2442)
MFEVINATPLDGYVLRIEFSDGVVGDVDCSFLLASGLGADLRDPAYFRQVRVDAELRTVVWPNGLDPAPELLHRRLKAGAGAVSSAA